jgi:cytochrome c
MEKIETSGGIPLTQSEIEPWEITVYPDGRNLPEGSGHAIRGEALYQQQCIACHGEKGQQGVAPRLAGPLGYPAWSHDPLQALSVGAWPHVTSIFDYIRRAMPHYAPKTLSDSDIYALTAYILHLNRIIEKDYRLDRVSMLKIEMPYKAKSFSAWEKLEKSRLNGKAP